MALCENLDMEKEQNCWTELMLKPNMGLGVSQANVILSSLHRVLLISPVCRVTAILQQCPLQRALPVLLSCGIWIPHSLKHPYCGLWVFSTTCFALQVLRWGCMACFCRLGLVDLETSGDQIYSAGEMQGCVSARECGEVLLSQTDSIKWCLKLSGPTSPHSHCITRSHKNPQ